MSPKYEQYIFTWIVATSLMHATLTLAAEPAPPSETTNDTAQAALLAMDHATAALFDWKEEIKSGTELRKQDWDEMQTRMENLFIELNWLNRHAPQKKPTVRPRSVVRPVESYGRNTVKLTQAWVDQMHALGPGALEKRAATVKQLRDALEGDNEYQRYAALKTLGQIGDVKYDKTSFRPLVLPLVETSKSNTLVAACYALYNTEPEPADLTLLQDAWNRRSAPLERSISHLLFLFSDGHIQGRSEEIVLELLSSSDPAVRREALRGLWGATVSDTLAAALVELADNRASHHDAIYFGLSTLKPKNAAVVDKLIETLQDSDWNDWSRALWGLGFGVPDELQTSVADALVEMYAARSDPRTRETCRRLIHQYAGEDALEKLPN